MASLFQIRRGQSLTGSLASGEIYYDMTSQSLALGSGSGDNIQLAKIGGINNGSFSSTHFTRESEAIFLWIPIK